MENLKFRRQYLFTSKKQEKFQNWKIQNKSNGYLYIHPDCEDYKLSNNEIEISIIGYFLDPHNPKKSTKEVLDGFSYVTSVDEIPQLLYSLVGRFILIFSKDQRNYIFNDACGLKTVFYTFKNNNFQIGSQSNLFELKTCTTKDERYKDYFKSNYVKNNREHWIPAGTSLSENVKQLIPNHYLDCSTIEQHRYYPNKKNTECDFNTSAKKMSEILKNTMLAAHNKFELALPMTAGLDSRTILSATKNIAEDILFYTLKYRNLTNKSKDISVPAELLQKLKYNHKVWDCKGPINKKFIDIYESNSNMAHKDDWGQIADGIYKVFPNKKIAVKGNCAEVGRCYYYSDGHKLPNIDLSKLLSLEKGWEDIGFIKTELSEWLDRCNKITEKFEYNILDLFYWEHRTGSWQAQSQLEWDIAQEAFTPFNNRELLDIILSADSKYRCSPDYSLFQECINLLWPEVLSVPINPLSFSQKIRGTTKKILVKTNLLDSMKSILNR